MGERERERGEGDASKRTQANERNTKGAGGNRLQETVISFLTLQSQTTPRLELSKRERERSGIQLVVQEQWKANDFVLFLLPFLEVTEEHEAKSY